MQRLRQWSLTLGTLAFIALPMLAAGCAENQATSSDPVSAKDSAGDDFGELGSLDDLGAPMEAGSGLNGLPEAGSGLGEFPESGSILE